MRKVPLEPGVNLAEGELVVRVLYYGLREAESAGVCVAFCGRRREVVEEEEEEIE